MLPSVNNAVVAQGLARLTDAFRNKIVTKAILKSLLAPFADLESVAWTVLNGIQNPTGDLLTRRARAVGEERNGRSDTDLLAAYAVRILINRSQGLADDIIRVANAIWPASYYEGGLADWFVEMVDMTIPPNPVAALIGEAKDAGTYGVLSYSIWDPATDFEWGDSGGSTVPGLGWSDTGGGYVGGLLYSLRVTQ